MGMFNLTNRYGKHVKFIPNNYIPSRFFTINYAYNLSNVGEKTPSVRGVVRTDILVLLVSHLNFNFDIFYNFDSFFPNS